MDLINQTKQNKKQRIASPKKKRCKPLILRSGAVSWFISGKTGPQHPLCPVMAWVSKPKKEKKKSTPEERFPQAPRRKNFAGWFLKKNSLGDYTSVQSTTQMELRRGAGRCDAPCILGRVLDSAFMQARVRLSCSDSLIYTERHKSRRHASPPRALLTEL